MGNPVLTTSVAAMLLSMALVDAAESKQYGPRIKVERNGKVQVGSVTVDTVPPGARVIERVIKGEPVDKAISNEFKARVDETKSYANVPLLQNEIENAFFDQIRDVIGDDTVDVIEVLNMPEQIQRAIPSTVVQVLSDPKDADDVMKKAAGVPLLTALIQAKEYYKNKGKPIPVGVKILLLKSFPASILKTARYVVDDFGGNVPAIVNKFQETLNGAHAVTIDNIIVFSSEPKDSDIFFWAHELQHTVQYSKMGMEKFAGEYTTNYKALEDEANVVAEAAEKKAIAVNGIISGLASN